MSNNSVSFLRISIHPSTVIIQGEPYKRVLKEIGVSINKSIIELEQIKKTNEFPEEYLESIAEDECLVVEHLLGTAFVLCQGYITKVVSKIKQYHKLAEHKGAKLTTTDGQKNSILKFAYNQNKFSSSIQLIDGFANYFKHRDEWNLNWEKLNDNQKKTAEVIKEVLTKPYNETNIILAGSYYLGNTEYNNPLIFFDKLEQWHLSLASAYDKELIAYDTAYRDGTQWK
ncbi:hypothetical protein H6G91_21350 [Nostoc muscorum FACHB-395]|nr:hypothetical protein [Desmonostoc muscorum FACHB-395]